MISLMVLAFSDFSKQFLVETDALGTAIDAVLQESHPIAFFNKKLNSVMQKALTYTRKLYVIRIAVNKWRQLDESQIYHSNRSKKY